MLETPNSPRAAATNEDTPAASASHALCVYAEPLVRGRRVILVGDASSGLAERLMELGARAVHVFDPEADRARAANAARGVVTRALSSDDFEVRDGAFDVAIVPELGAVDPAGTLLARLRRLVGRSGAAIVGGGSRSPDAVDYYELYDRVALQFSHVRMIGELRFGGVALADLGLEGAAPEVTVDTQLAGEGLEPERFFALAGQAEVRLADYAIFQLPAGAAAAPPGAADGVAGPDSGHAVLAQAQLRASLLEAQVDELRAKLLERAATDQEQVDRARELEALLGDANARVMAAEGQLRDLIERAERAAREAQRAEGELSRERDRADALEGALAAAETALIALRASLRDVEERSVSRDAELAQLASTLDAARRGEKEAQAAHARAAASEERAAAMIQGVAMASEEHASELGAMEASLRERAGAVRALEHEVARREGLVRELLGALEEAREEPARGEPVATRASVDGALQEKLDRVSMELARREGEREEMAWRVSELEETISRLEAEQTEMQVTLPPPAMARQPIDDGPSSRRTEQLEDELDALRKALAQEHAARALAESGEELATARAELARQATLLEQLSRELEARDRAGGHDRGDPARSVDRSEA